jgi:FtsZ-binding cell division protein ZapB
MSRAIDVVRLSGDEYDRLMDEREILRQEAARAWREVDAIAKERDDHHRWRKELADQLGKVERQRDVLARTVNTQETELQALQKVAQAYETLRAEAEEWECDGLGLFAQHGWWEAVDEAMDAAAAVAPNADECTKEEAVHWLRRLFDDLVDAHVRCAAREEELRLIKARYDELLYAVGDKHPDESRHETLLRYAKRAASVIDSLESAAKNADPA